MHGSIVDQQYRAHEPIDVGCVHEEGKVVDSDNAGDAGTACVKRLVSLGGSMYIHRDWVAYKTPTAIIPQIAIFFRMLICGATIRGKGIRRTMKSLNMLIIPSARKSWLALIYVPLAPLNLFQK